MLSLTQELLSFSGLLDLRMKSMRSQSLSSSSRIQKAAESSRPQLATPSFTCSSLATSSTSPVPSMPQMNTAKRWVPSSKSLNSNTQRKGIKTNKQNRQKALWCSWRCFHRFNTVTNSEEAPRWAQSIFPNKLPKTSLFTTQICSTRLTSITLADSSRMEESSQTRSSGKSTEANMKTNLVPSKLWPIIWKNTKPATKDNLIMMHWSKWVHQSHWSWRMRNCNSQLMTSWATRYWDLRLIKTMELSSMTFKRVRNTILIWICSILRRMLTYI